MNNDKQNNPHFFYYYSFLHLFFFLLSEGVGEKTLPRLYLFITHVVDVDKESPHEVFLTLDSILLHCPDSPNREVLEVTLLLKTLIPLRKT